LKLDYQPPRHRDIIPEPFRRLDKRGRGRSLLLAALTLIVAGAIVWIWRAQQPQDISPATRSPATNRTALPTAPAGQTSSLLTTAVDSPTFLPQDQPQPSRQSVSNPQLPESDPEIGIRLQVALARLGFSPGAIDGIVGSQTRSALRAFQKAMNLRPTGVLDPATRSHLEQTAPIYTNYVVTALDLARLQRLGRSWLAKSRQDKMDYEGIVELLAEKSQSDEDLVWRLNPNLDWKSIQPGTSIKIPAVAVLSPAKHVCSIRISLAERVLQVFDESRHIIAHFPCSIGQRVESRPLGLLYVTSIAPDPNYTFDPATFPESAEAQQLGRKLILNPGPNNPVGSVWIGLDRPGYGIHGTPEPEKVGRTESHGCFRLANWNAEYLLNLVWVGMPVAVE
jgi:lipoprotein-anchoring transpeptidase ErfK/SrfK